MSGAEARVAELEQELALKNARIAELEREVPLGATGRKAGRLGLEVKDMQMQDDVERLKWPSHKVRSAFMDFFMEKCGHKYWKSCPVVPHNDPTLLFINSGMAQYKPLFLGQADPNTEFSKLKRACNTQKCIRAGGKHNDLDDVGKDVYHHTFFEMLGNWSFGDYFKEEVIDWSWTLLTEVFGLDKERLYASYFKGDENVPEDLEAKEIWKRYLPEERILAFDATDNFWEMGDTGPCGPCSEIHYDRIGGRNAADLVNMDDPNVVEIWNLVFMQFNRKADSSLERLPACHVDTGMGFERLVAALQDKDSNYDTDVFTPILRDIEKVADVHPYTGKTGEDDVGNVDMAYRVVADHIRTLTFAIADGGYPSNEGRGYVLRRILRRAVRYGQDVLKMPQGSFCKLVHVVVQHFSEVFPEIAEKEQLIYEVIQDEEETFARTLLRGVEQFKKLITRLEAEGKKEVPGKDAFTLFEAMGFPVDLTELMAEERGFTLDKKGFEERLAAHVELSKGKAKVIDANALPKMEAKETSYLENDLKLKPTVHDSVYTWHEDLPGATVCALFTADGFTEEISVGHEKVLGVVLDASNFYYESGGQLADTGSLILESDRSLQLAVDDCQSFKGFIVHAGMLETNNDEEGTTTTLRVGDKVTCKVDYTRRSDLAKNHTGTHLLNFALRKAVSSDASQKGSVVTPDKLRFDFNSQKPVSIEQQMAVEAIVRAKIRESLPVHTKVVPLPDAMRISSLCAVFGETYPDPVRVVSVGPTLEEVLEDPLNEKWRDYSIELCGGTHLKKSSEARAFSLVSESAVAKGIRRVVCLTGDAAFNAANHAEALRARLENANSLQGAELVKEQKSLQSDINDALISVTDKHELQVGVEALTRKLLALQKEELKKGVEFVLSEIEAAKANGNKFVVLQLPESGLNPAKLGGEVGKKLKKSPFPFFLAQASASTDSILLFATVPKDLTEKLGAKAWVLEAGAPCEAKGGGSDMLFNGKGSGADNVTSVVDVASSVATEKLA